jgi:hypothetical protein
MPDIEKIIVDLPTPSVDFSHPRQEMLSIEKNDLKHYVDLADEEIKIRFNFKSAFWYLFVFGLGNLVNMWMSLTQYIPPHVYWYIIWYTLLGVGLTGGLALNFRRNDVTINRVLASESNKVYRSKVYKEDV